MGPAIVRKGKVETLEVQDDSGGRNSRVGGMKWVAVRVKIEELEKEVLDILEEGNCEAGEFLA